MRHLLTSPKVFRIFWIALVAAIAIVGLKHLLHVLDIEVIQQSSLQNSVASGVFFVVGFVLSATISDYKESERIPSDFASNVEDMYADAVMIYASYPVFDLPSFRSQLIKVIHGFKNDVRKKSHVARTDVRALGTYFSAMESGKVPPNFIVKLKSQQAGLLRNLYRVNYIQTIRFIPSATILVRSIVALLIVMLLLTNVDPFYGGLVIIGLMSFILIYMLILIETISTPFHSEGKTKDDVSLFLLDEVEAFLKTSKK